MTSEVTNNDHVFIMQFGWETLGLDINVDAALTHSTPVNIIADQQHHNQRRERLLIDDVFLWQSGAFYLERQLYFPVIYELL